MKTCYAGNQKLLRQSNFTLAKRRSENRNTQQNILKIYVKVGSNTKLFLSFKRSINPYHGVHSKKIFLTFETLFPHPFFTPPFKTFHTVPPLYSQTRQPIHQPSQYISYIIRLKISISSKQPPFKF